MITILLLGGIVAGLGLLANRAPAASSPAVAASAPAIGSIVSPTPSTPTPVSHAISPFDEFSTGYVDPNNPANLSFYETALKARAQLGIPIVAAPQPQASAAPRVAPYVFPGSTAPRIVAPVRPAPARAPIAQVGTGGLRTASRTKLSLF